MKKKLFVIAMAVLLLAGVTAGTVAYFTTKTVAHNVITSGEIDIELVETMLTPEGEKEWDDQTGIMPGVTTSKIVRIHNVGSNPAWVRVSVEVEINGKKVDLTEEGAVLTIDFDTTGKWEKHGDYYYYTEKLQPNTDKTIPLFREVKLLETADNAYQNARIEIGVTAQGIQSQNNEREDDEDITSVWPLGVQIMEFLR